MTKLVLIGHEYERGSSDLDEPITTRYTDDNAKFEANSVNASLVCACSLGDVEDVKLYLDQGANIETRSIGPHEKRGYTPLFIACECDDLDVVKLLLDRSANIEARNYYDQTPLMI